MARPEVYAQEDWLTKASTGSSFRLPPHLQVIILYVASLKLTMVKQSHPRGQKTGSISNAFTSNFGKHF